MVYRFRPSEKKHTQREKKPYQRAGYNSPRRLYGYRYDAVDIEMLFELAKLEGAVNKKVKRRRKGALKSKILRLAASLKGAILTAYSYVARSVRVSYGYISEKIGRAIEKRRARKKLPSVTPTLAGSLVAAMLVLSLSAFAVLYKLLLSEYFGFYRTITVPDMVGRDYSSARAELDEDDYNITVSFEYSDKTPSGMVISQYPSGGVDRKIFSGGELCSLKIVVSRGEETLVMGDYVGKRARDARLELKNAGALVTVIEEYSDEYQKGDVISTSPAVGESFALGNSVVLRVSQGKRVILSRVPNVCGLDESDAVSRILTSGFVVGKISYQNSSERAGKVISQSVAAGERREKGGTISFVVSAGAAFNEKTVPSLYGLSIAEAKERLAEYGLVVGNIYAVESNEVSGTVISQSPAAGSPISSSVITVDMYVSS